MLPLGFDLVGEEAKGYPIKEFIPELLEFRRQCAEQNLDIPFLFHCGETLDMGTDTDGNLVDALLLGSKRIGHGFALAKRPHDRSRLARAAISRRVQGAARNRAAIASAAGTKKVCRAR